MKVVSYVKKGVNNNPLGRRYTSHARVFYIPKFDVILYRQTTGMWSVEEFLYTRNEDELSEARMIAEGSNPETEATYSEIREFDYDVSRLRGLVDMAERKERLERKVREEIEALDNFGRDSTSRDC